MLRSHRDSTFSHFTISEVNGGIDGLLIAMQARELESGTERRLSQILDAYYNSQDGLKTKVLTFNFNKSRISLHLIKAFKVITKIIGVIFG
jgi:hypothetical protein